MRRNEWILKTEKGIIKTKFLYSQYEYSESISFPVIPSMQKEYFCYDRFF